jgi:hypothetical protein
MTKDNPLEHYKTPAPLVEALIDRVPSIQNGTVIEPCAGDLAIADFFPGCRTNDIDTQWPTDWHYDATKRESWERFGPFDWTVTNTPFSLAQKILPLAFEYCYGVAFLLRLTYQEPCFGRSTWLKKNKRYFTNLIIFNPRPKFSRNKDGVLATDSVTVAWMIWQKIPVWQQGYTNVSYVTGWNKEE